MSQKPELVFLPEIDAALHAAFDCPCSKEPERKRDDGRDP